MARANKVRPAVAKAAKLLRLDKLRLPPNPRIVDIRVEDFYPFDGEPALRVRLILDEGCDVEKIGGTNVRAIKRTIRDALLAHEIDDFAVITLVKQSELDDGAEEE